MTITVRPITVFRSVLIHPSQPVSLMWEQVEVQLENLLKNVFVSLVLSGSDVSYPLLNSVIPSNVRSNFISCHRDDCQVFRPHLPRQTRPSEALRGSGFIFIFLDWHQWQVAAGQLLELFVEIIPSLGFP